MNSRKTKYILCVIITISIIKVSNNNNNSFEQSKNSNIINQTLSQEELEKMKEIKSKLSENFLSMQESFISLKKLLDSSLKQTSDFFKNSKDEIKRLDNKYTKIDDFLEEFDKLGSNDSISNYKAFNFSKTPFSQCYREIFESLIKLEYKFKSEVIGTIIGYTSNLNNEYNQLKKDVDIIISDSEEDLNNLIRFVIEQKSPLFYVNKNTNTIEEFNKKLEKIPMVVANKKDYLFNLSGLCVEQLSYSFHLSEFNDMLVDIDRLFGNIINTFDREIQKRLGMLREVVDEKKILLSLKKELSEKYPKIYTPNYITNIDRITGLDEHKISREKQQSTFFLKPKICKLSIIQKYKAMLRKIHNDIDSLYKI